MVEEALDLVTKEAFSASCENLIINEGYDLIDAILHLCKTYGIDEEDVAKFLTKNIKEYLEGECLKKRLIQKDCSSLDI